MNHPYRREEVYIRRTGVAFYAGNARINLSAPSLNSGLLAANGFMMPWRLRYANMPACRTLDVLPDMNARDSYGVQAWH